MSDNPAVGWVVGLGLVALLVGTLLFNQPASNIAGQETIPRTTPNFHLTREATNGYATIKVTDQASGATVLQFGVDRHGRLHQSPEQSRGQLRTTEARSYFLTDVATDLGTWAGYWDGRSDSRARGWQAGVRYSPIRLFYDTVAPDAVLSADGIGVGASAYLPESVGPGWSNVGLGLWYVAPFDSDARPGWAVGLAFSIRPGG